MLSFGLRRGVGQRLPCRSAVSLHAAPRLLRRLLNIHGHLVFTRATSGSSDGAGLPAPSLSGAEPSLTADAAARPAGSVPAARSPPTDGALASVAFPVASVMAPEASVTGDTAPLVPSLASAPGPSSAIPSAPADGAVAIGSALAAATFPGTVTASSPPSPSVGTSGGSATSSSSTSSSGGSSGSPLPSGSVTPTSASPSTLPPFVQQLLNWLASVLAALQQFPAWVQLQHLRRLREACEEDPADPDKHAAYLAELVRSNPREVVARVESRRFGVNAAVVAEYLRALVETGRVAELVKGDAAVAAAVASASAATSAAAAAREVTHPQTLSELLQDLQEQLTTATAGEGAGSNGFGALDSKAAAIQGAGGAGAGAAAELPGTSLRRPLHVVVSGLPLGVLQAAAAAGPSPSSAAAQSAAGSNMPLLLRPLALLWRLISMTMGILVLAMLYLIGTQAIRRVQGSGGAVVAPTAVNAGPAATAAGGSASGSSSAGSTSGGGGPSVEPKEYKKDELPEKSIRTFKDVKGCDEAKEELREVVEFLKNPTKFTRLGAKLPKGVLLTGPPGTGKTLLAKAVAGEAGVPFFYRAGSEFEELYVGVGSRRMRALFAAAKKRAPCIVFIDEIDAIGGNRKAWENHTRKTLNQLLVEMDGFESTEGIIVMAATNLPESLDPALKRPGRFDRQVAVPLPDIKGRRDILEYYLQDKPLGPDVDRELLARQTQGFSGADLSNLINEGAILAAKEGSETITQRMLDWAYDKILMGVERKSVKRTLEARRRTSFHEAGHALVALATPGAAPIHKATIVPRGHALGMVMQVGREDEFSINRQQMLARIWVCMGGTVAEELVFGSDQVSSGATDDLRQATSMARHMVAECGMSAAIGPVYVAAHDERHGGAGVSEATRQRVDAEVAELLAEAKRGVRTLLSERMQDLRTLAEALLDRETLTREEITALLQPADSSNKQDPGSTGGGGGGGGGGDRERGSEEEPRAEEEPASVPAPAPAQAAAQEGASVATAAAVVLATAEGANAGSSAAAAPTTTTTTTTTTSAGTSTSANGATTGTATSTTGADTAAAASPRASSRIGAAAAPVGSRDSPASTRKLKGWAQDWYDSMSSRSAETAGSTTTTTTTTAATASSSATAAEERRSAGSGEGPVAAGSAAATATAPTAEIAVESDEFGGEGSLVGLGGNVLAAAAVAEVMGGEQELRAMRGCAAGGPAGPQQPQR